jgi:hypothetical protein
VLARESLKEKAGHVLQEGPEPQSGKCNNNDLKFMIQWYKRADNGIMHKYKECLLLRYCETCGHVMSGSYVPFMLAASTSAPTASDSHSRVHTNTAKLNLNPINFSATVPDPVLEAQSLEAKAL